MTRLGLGKSYRHILTVRGRTTGFPRSTPVDVMELDGKRWLVAPYGITDWVRNARAAGEVTITRGRHSETVVVREFGPAASAPVLRLYLREVRVMRHLFEVTPEAPVEVLEAIATRHPVFQIFPTT